MEYPRPILTVDVVVLALDEGALQLGTLTRPEDPFAGCPALPGGFVRVDEDQNTRAAALRVLHDKIGLVDPFCQQLATFSGPTRDPRGWSASVAYYALVPADRLAEVKAHTRLTWNPAAEAQGLAFDHSQIVQAALDRIHTQTTYSSLPALLLGQSFTLADLRHCYELLLRQPLNDSAFRRKIADLDFLEPVPGAQSRSTARPAQLYRQRSDKLALFDRTI
jgi:8-oxo-dGTP diphosphatase